VPRTTRVFILIHAGITYDLYLVQLRKMGDVFAVNKNWNLLLLRPCPKSNTVYNSWSKTDENYAEFCNIVQSQHTGELLTVNFHPQNITCKNIKFVQYVVTTDFRVNVVKNVLRIQTRIFILKTITEMYPVAY
jgi:hypothetical protein